MECRIIFGGICSFVLFPLANDQLNRCIDYHRCLGAEVTESRWWWFAWWKGTWFNCTQKHDEYCHQSLWSTSQQRFKGSQNNNVSMTPKCWSKSKKRPANQRGFDHQSSASERARRRFWLFTSSLPRFGLDFMTSWRFTSMEWGVSNGVGCQQANKINNYMMLSCQADVCVCARLSLASVYMFSIIFVRWYFGMNIGMMCQIDRWTYGWMDEWQNGRMEIKQHLELFGQVRGHNYIERRQDLSPVPWWLWPIYQCIDAAQTSRSMV